MQRSDVGEDPGNGDQAPSIGIALSGGGSRAMAFHLGCLRALDGLGHLKAAKVLSCVSGGCVLGAMYTIHEGDFPSFEKNVRAVLARGFIRPALKTAVTTSEGVKAILCFVVMCACLTSILPARLLTWLFCVATGTPRTPGDRWMPRRFASRTTLLRRTFDELLFKGRTLGSLRADGPRLVALAAELRTGSAFYFGAREAGCWRFGRIDTSKIPLAHAVAASAAYPLFLPALDEYLAFDKADGSRRTERVTLTDGGIYDNMGLSPLWPDRDPKVSVVVEPVDTIIACRAGYGLRTLPPSLFIKSRLTSSFSAVSARAQNAAQTRLFDLKAAGRIRQFALPYLDQDDRRLAHPPADLVTRDQVADYPTDFGAMPAKWIERLSKRGEQMTLAVIREHVPDLMMR